jgi:hypothetical protein
LFAVICDGLPRVLQAFQPARFEKTTVTGEALNHCKLPLRAFLAARFRKKTANGTEYPSAIVTQA